MSVENFCFRFPATAEIRNIIDRKRRPNTSRIETLAAEFVIEAGYGLRDATKGLTGLGVALKPDSQAFLNLPQEKREDIILHQAALTFGISIQTLDKSLFSKLFNMGLWYQLYNNSISGTPFSALKLNEDEKETEFLHSEQWGKMVELAKQDKTLSIFFREGFQTAPNGFKTIISHAGILPTIQKQILPRWRKRAKIVVD